MMPGLAPGILFVAKLVVVRGTVDGKPNSGEDFLC
jgi:hypothetical protein